MASALRTRRGDICGDGPCVSNHAKAYRGTGCQGTWPKGGQRVVQGTRATFIKRPLVLRTSAWQRDGRENRWVVGRRWIAGEAPTTPAFDVAVGSARYSTAVRAARSLRDGCNLSESRQSTNDGLFLFQNNGYCDLWCSGFSKLGISVPWPVNLAQTKLLQQSSRPWPKRELLEATFFGKFQDLLLDSAFAIGLRRCFSAWHQSCRVSRT